MTCNDTFQSMPQEIRAAVDSIIRSLRSNRDLSPAAAIEQLCLLIFLKFMDEEENNREADSRLSTVGVAAVLPRFPAQAERFRWSRWSGKPGEELRNFIRDDVFPYMGSLVREDPQVANYFRDAALEIVDPATLKQVVSALDSIDFQVSGTEMTGCLFEYLLTSLGQATSEGQFHTAQPIRDIMVAMVAPESKDTINDPTCGTGSLLVDALKNILANCSDKNAALSSLEPSISGADISRQMARIATMNLMLHGIRNPRITRANTLSESGGLSEETLNRKYSVVLCDPPFGGLLQREPIRRELPPNSRKSELLFTYLAMESLLPGGRAAIVVPEGLLFASTTVHVELRKKLVEDFELLAVVSLPAGAFKPITSIKTDIIVFRRPLDGRACKPGRTMFYEIGLDVFVPVKESAGNSSENHEIQQLIKIWKECQGLGFECPPDNAPNSPQEPETELHRYWWATSESIAAKDYNLVAGHYRPQLAKNAAEGNHAELIRELLSLEQELVSRLEQLLSKDQKNIGDVGWIRERIDITRRQLDLFSKL